MIGEGGARASLTPLRVEGDQRAEGEAALRDRHERRPAFRQWRHLKELETTSQRLFGNGLREKESCQSDLDADVLPEPAHSLEIMKHVTGNRKFLNNWNLKLEMPP